MKIKLVCLSLLTLALASCGVAPSSSFSSPIQGESSQSSVEETTSFESSSSSKETSEEPSSAFSEIPSVESTPSSISSLNYESEDPLKEPYIGRQYYLNQIGDIFAVWDNYRGDGITIAVIDMGFKPDHEDFYFADGSSKVSTSSASFTTTGSQTKTEVGIGYVINEAESHGTFCAGVAAAGINGKGVVGVAPNASLLLLKTDAKPKSIVAAFKYAADNGARVVTISIGSYYDYGGDLNSDGSDLGTVFDPAIEYCHSKGVAVISAAGNGGLDGNPTEFTFPGCVDGVIGVGGLAANNSDEIWEGSSYNSSPKWEFCDVFAPADMMFGCCHYGGKKYDGGWKGTSFASPQVAGLAALYFQKYPTRNHEDFERDLYASCHALTKSTIVSKNQTGHGRIDAAALLGITPKKSFTVTVKTSWGKANCYLWNSLTGTAMKEWPGVAMTKSGSTYAYEVNGNYDFIIFNNGSAQTVNLNLSAFASGHGYDLTSSTSEVGCLVGNYI